VIPLGAGSKEHGPHLKLGTDAVLADYLTRRVLESSDVVVAPTLPYHFFPAFTEYPGSTSLTLETARALTTEAALGLASYGPRRFYVLNTGVSTTRALQPAARALAAQGILLGYTDLLAQLDRVSASIRKEEGGTHADEVETSMMLYIDPASVDMRRAVKEFNPSPGPSLQLTRRRGGPGTFSESGVWGDPTLATREKGRVIVEGLVKAILDDIEAIAREAFAGLPAEFRNLCGDIVFMVQDFPDDDVTADMELESEFDILGLFQGPDLAQRDGRLGKVTRVDL